MRNIFEDLTGNTCFRKDRFNFNKFYVFCDKYYVYINKYMFIVVKIKYINLDKLNNIYDQVNFIIKLYIYYNI